MKLPLCLHTIGVVNRGDAALRCVRAVKALRAQEGGSLRVAVLYTDVDREAPFVRHADVAVRLAAPEGEVKAYLDHEGVIRALRAGGADAVWPGWGFLAEDPLFADRVIAEGWRFLGPSGAAMRALGDKVAAKQAAERAGVPVAAWSGAVVADEAEAVDAGDRLGYPLLVKAAAGGGGRGIRVVEDPSALPAAFRSAAAEAAAAFGDARLFLERKVSGGRHIEVQIAADVHGNVRALGARDCSVQRRHQKLVEEAPPPGVPTALVARLAEASLRLACSVGYVGLGTVEFLIGKGAEYFLEINPRLQVEHGITEATTGLDLVQLQIRIGREESLETLHWDERGVAIEARVCAEDPAAGFLPAPGRIARFDPALGPGIRVDAGVAAGSVVPAAFDSLIAKVIATGATREEARSRLVCALRDLDLVIEGGASNAGYLIDLLESADFRVGAVDTEWVDRGFAEGAARHMSDASDALVGAAILAYQRRRRDARLNFFADTTSISPVRAPPSAGQEIDLSFDGVGYRVEVFALGSWRYRVHLDGRTSTAVLREADAHLARLELGDRMRRIVYDATEAGLRLELDGRPFRFGWETTGQVRAATPAVVVAIQVGVGDRVVAGEVLGFLEAMKMEIGFAAPVAGVVTEVRTGRGPRVEAGEVLIVIDPAPAAESAPVGARLVLVRADAETSRSNDWTADGAAVGDLADLDGFEPERRRAAIAALRDEVRSVLLGYDFDPARAQALVSLVDSGRADGLSSALRLEVAALGHEAVLFADLEQLFVATPPVAGTGEIEPSNAARLRGYVRRMRAGGAGIADDFLHLLRTALAHYGVTSLAHGDVLERALLRLFATRNAADLRQRLVRSILRCLVALARAGVVLADAAALADALRRLAAMRDQLSDALADAAIEAEEAIVELPARGRRTDIAARIAPWVTAPDGDARLPPLEVLHELAGTPRPVFDRVVQWLGDTDPQRRSIALTTYLLRLYAPDGKPASVAVAGRPGGALRLELADGRVVVGVAGAATNAPDAAALLSAALIGDDPSGPAAVHAFELVVPRDQVGDPATIVAATAEALGARLRAERCTLSFVGPGGDVHHTFVPTYRRGDECTALHGMHPQAAARVGLGRLANFELERLPGADDLYCFFGRSRIVAADERFFVLADVRGQAGDDIDATAAHVAAFERAFHQAASALRALRSARDPRRRLHWNRLALFLGPPVALDVASMERIARRLAPATRHLGLEKVVVRARIRDGTSLAAAAEPVEVVVSDLTGGHMEITLRTPRTAPLEPAGHYQRRVVEARRRRLVYPYEIIHMLTGRNGGTKASFEEFDLESRSDRPRARSVDGRPHGENGAGIVFGIVTTPTDKVPEGMQRVLIVSDPTRDMGALAAPECDRIIAAIDLAEERRLPLEWVPISSGARIAMDSGTENLDATARVARRLVQFTERGGVVHLVVYGVNVGAQSYWDALATMLNHTRGALIMTPEASLVLTGRAALEASGSVAAEDEVALGGFERVMGPNGEAQYYATDLAAAVRILEEHHRYTYVVAGESGPRRHATRDPVTRDVTTFPYPSDLGHGFATVGEIFDDATNPGRKRPFAMRAVMQALIDQDGGALERWRSWAGAQSAIVWDAHLGGVPISLIGIESANVPRDGYRPVDGPAVWSGGTLFPRSSKKIARALNVASGNRPVVILANLSGFDGSPESLRSLQLEHGAEIARAVVRFEGPLFFVVVSRYHGGAYVVFSKALNPALRALALTGSYASVIGGAPAAAVIFTREVRARAAADPTVSACHQVLGRDPTPAARDAYERALAAATRAAEAKVAAEFDAVHTVERACRVGSLDEVIEPQVLRPVLVHALEAAVPALLSSSAPRERYPRSSPDSHAEP